MALNEIYQLWCGLFVRPTLNCDHVHYRVEWEGFIMMKGRMHGAM